MKKLQQPAPTVAFEHLQFLFKPGHDVYYHLVREHFSHVVAVAIVMQTSTGE